MKIRIRYTTNGNKFYINALKINTFCSKTTQHFMKPPIQKLYAAVPIINVFNKSLIHRICHSNVRTHFIFSFVRVSTKNLKLPTLWMASLTKYNIEFEQSRCIYKNSISLCLSVSAWRWYIYVAAIIIHKRFSNNSTTFSKTISLTINWNRFYGDWSRKNNILL